MIKHWHLDDKIWKMVQEILLTLWWWIMRRWNVDEIKIKKYCLDKKQTKYWHNVYILWTPIKWRNNNYILKIKHWHFKISTSCLYHNCDRAPDFQNLICSPMLIWHRQQARYGKYRTRQAILKKLIWSEEN